MISTNDTFARNSAGASGGGAFNDLSVLTTVNDTIADNFGGGIVTNQGATWNSVNTIVAGNLVSSTQATPSDVVKNSPSSISASNTMIGDVSSAGGIIGGSNGNIVGVATSAIFKVDSNGSPLLANNGGPTETIMLAAGSPAIGAGGGLGQVTSNGDAGATLTVNSTTYIAPGDYLRVGTEIVQVSAVTGTTTLLVLRAQVGTAQSNLDNQSITLASDQRGFLRAAGDLGTVDNTNTTAPSIVVVTDPGGNYNGTPFPAMATVTNIGGSTISGTTTFTYYNGGTVNGTGTSTAPTNAGTYTVVASFVSSDVNYGNATSSPVTFTIAPVTPTPTVAALDVGGVFNNKPFTATATVTGIGNVTPVGTTTFTYYNGSTVNGTGTSAAPTNFGTYTVVASFTSSNNSYTNATSNPVTFKITPAPPTVTVVDNGGTVTGNPYPATATVAGVGGVAGSTLENVGLTLVYYSGSTASGTPLTGAPTFIGTYTVVASFAGSTDYTSASKLVTFAIVKPPLPNNEQVNETLILSNNTTYELSTIGNLYRFESQSITWTLVTNSVISFHVNVNDVLYVLQTNGNLTNENTNQVIENVISFQINVNDVLYVLQTNGNLTIYGNTTQVIENVISFQLSVDGILYVLNSSENLVMINGNASTLIDTNVTQFRFSNDGTYLIDLHNDGTLYEQLSANLVLGAWTKVDQNVHAFKVNGNNDVVDLHVNGTLIEFTSYSSATSFVTIDVGVTSFAIAGNGDVVDLHPTGKVFEFTAFRSDSAVNIDVGVTSFAIAGNGDVVDLHASGNLFEFTAFRSGTAVNIDAGVISFAIAGNGDVVDLHPSGKVFEFTAFRRASFVNIDDGVTSFAIAGNGDVVDLHSTGKVFEFTAFRSGSAVNIDAGVISFAIAGNGDVVDLHATGNVFEYTAFRSGSAVNIDAGVIRFAIAGNGDVVDLHGTGNVFEFTAFRSGTAVNIDVGVVGFAIAGNGDVVDLHGSGNLFEFTAFRSGAAVLIDSGVVGFGIAGNGFVEDQRNTGLKYIQTSFRGPVNQPIPLFV